MRKTVTLVLIAATCMWGCKKDKVQIKESENSDKVNSVFRVISNASAKYSISIIETSSVGTTDTLQNVTSDSRANFEFGFTPKVGSTVKVKAVAPNASSLNITVAYKAVRLGLDTVKRVDKGLSADFMYVIKD